MILRPPRPTAQLLRDEKGLKSQQLALWRAAAATAALAAAAASALLSKELPPPPLLPSAVTAEQQQHRHRPPSSSSAVLPPRFGEGAEGYFPRGCVWRERAGGGGEGKGKGGGVSSSSSPSPPQLEFLLRDKGSWTLSMPEACTLAGDPKIRGGGKEQKRKKKKRTKSTKKKDSDDDADSSSPASFPLSSPFPLSSTSQSCDALACSYRGGLWLSGRGRWHSIIEGTSRGGIGGLSSPAAGKVSRNLRLSPLRVSGSAAAFASAVAGDASSSSSSSSALRFASGRTLVIDFGFYRHPSAIGHWAEVAGQVASQVFAEEEEEEVEGAAAAATERRSKRDDGGDENDDESDDDETRRGRTVRAFDRVLLLHFSRHHFGEWACAALAAALGVEPGGSLPPVFFQQGVELLSGLRPPAPSSSSSSPLSYSPPSIEQKEAPLRARLEGLFPGEWLVFEEVLVVRDSSTGGPRFAAPAAAARAWRRRFLSLHGVSLPQSPANPGSPPMVLYLRKKEDRRVLNEAALLSSLRSNLGVRVVASDFLKTSSSSSSSKASLLLPVREQLLLMSSADVLLSAHTSALAGALFLRQRGEEGGSGKNETGAAAAVVELLQLRWGEWGSLDESFKALTSSFDNNDGGETGTRKALRHGSWRATRRRHAAYPGRRDGVKFGSWGLEDEEEGEREEKEDESRTSGKSKSKRR